MEISDLDSDLKYFQSIPWTSQLLQNPDYNPVPTPSRKKKKSTEDAMFAETLNTKDTVQAWLTLQKKTTSKDTPISEFRFLMSLAYAVNGFANLVHGGMISLIMDEVMGTLLQLNEHAGHEVLKHAFTAELKTRFLRPIPTPSVVVATARLKDVKGRKIMSEAIIEDEDGNVMATGEALWVRAKDQGAKL